MTALFITLLSDAQQTRATDTSLSRCHRCNHCDLPFTNPLLIFREYAELKLLSVIAQWLRIYLKHLPLQKRDIVQLSAKYFNINSIRVVNESHFELSMLPHLQWFGYLICCEPDFFSIFDKSHIVLIVARISDLNWVDKIDRVVAPCGHFDYGFSIDRALILNLHSAIILTKYPHCAITLQIETGANLSIWGRDIN